MSGCHLIEVLSDLYVPCQLKTPAQKEPLDLAEKQGVKRKAENFDANDSSNDAAGKAKEASTADGELFNHKNPSSFDCAY